MFYKGLYRKNVKKIFLSETTRLSLDIMYGASSSEPLPNLFQLCHLGPVAPLNVKM